MIRLARSFSAAQMPSGTPITTASATDTIISDSVSIAGSHRPTTPGNVMHAAANVAERQRPVLAISANTTTGNVNHGSPRKKSVSESSVASTRCRNGSRNHVNSGWVRRFSWIQSCRSSIGSARWMYRLSGNSSKRSSDRNASCSATSRPAPTAGIIQRGRAVRSTGAVPPMATTLIGTPRRAGRGRSCGRRCRAVVRPRRRRRSDRRCRAAAGSAGRSWCAPAHSGRRSSRHRASPTAR